MANRGRGRGAPGRVARQEEEEEEEPSQSSQATRSHVVMDPGQDLSDRRKIRRDYRELIQQTNGIATLELLID